MNPLHPRDTEGRPPSPRRWLLQGLQQPDWLAAAGLATWDVVLREARAANLLARLAHVLDQAGLNQAVPSAVQPHLLAARRLSQHQHDAIGWECRHLERALASLQLPVVLLKGSAYVMGGLRASKGRLFGDIDLLVPRHALPRVEGALRLHGWSPGAVDPYDDRYYRQWMHELPPFVHMKRGTTLDVHHNILPLTAADVPDSQALLDRSLPRPGSCLRLPAREDLVIHSAVHLFHEGETVHALRDLLDLQALCSEFAEADTGFWTRLVDRTRELGLAWPVFLAARQMQRVLQVHVPPKELTALQRAAGLSGPRLALLDWAYGHAFLGAQSGKPGAGQAVARGFLYLRGHALRMPLHRLALHLSRKGFYRLFRNTSRTV